MEGDERMPRVMFVPGRAVRVIPKGWQHPKDRHGYIGLNPASYYPTTEEAIKEYLEYSDELPPRSDYMPDPGDGETEIVAYESVSEGPPISPPFANTPEGRR